MRRLLQVAGVASLLIALVACGGGGSKSASNGAPSVVTTPASALVLTVSDLPAGWTVDNSTSSGSTSNDCSIKSAIKVNSATHTTATFSYGGSIPAFTQPLAVYNSTEAAASAFHQVKSTLDACTGFDVNNQGETARMNIGATSFLAIGSDSAAYTGSMAVNGLTITMGFVLVRQANVNFIVALADLGSTDVAKLEEFARLADNNVVTLNTPPEPSTTSPTTT